LRYGRHRPHIPNDPRRWNRRPSHPSRRVARGLGAAFGVSSAVRHGLCREARRKAIASVLASGAPQVGSPNVDETVLREKIGEMLSEAQGTVALAPSEAAGADPSAQPRASGLRREMAMLEDNLDRLRLAIKYLVFDLEATKRENRLLRELLD